MFALGSAVAPAQQTNAPSGASAAPPASSPPGLSAEAQWRPGVDAGRFPLIEVYLANATSKPVEWKRAFLNGVEVQGMTNGVVWTQFYPTSVAKSGETVLLQINLIQPPTVLQTIEAETGDGQRVNAQLGPFKVPYTRFTGITFSPDFRRAFVAYFSVRRGLSPVRVAINGRDCTKNIRLMERTSGRMQSTTEENPGMFSVDLPEPASHGLPIHLRLEFRKDGVVQSLLRASSGFFLDAFGVDEKDEKLRKELGLDIRPLSKMLDADPACEDLHAGKQYGRSMAAILAARRSLYASTNENDRLSYVYLCTAATPNAAYSIYGQCCDAIQVNPYELHYGTNPRFIEAEELSFQWGWEAGRPRPWHWIPEVFEIAGLVLEPGALRLLTYSALGRGCKGIKYYVFGGKEGFQNSKPLTAEIKTLNADIKRLAPILSAAIPLSVETVGSKESGLRVYTLASGDEGMLVVIRNLDYSMDRKPNQWGAAPRFKFTPKENVKLTVRKPEWLAIRSVRDPLRPDRPPFEYQDKFDLLDLNIGRLELVQTVWIQNTEQKTEVR